MVEVRGSEKGEVGGGISTKLSVPEVLKVRVFCVGLGSSRPSDHGDVKPGRDRCSDPRTPLSSVRLVLGSPDGCKHRRCTDRPSLLTRTPSWIPSMNPDRVLDRPVKPQTGTV